MHDHIFQTCQLSLRSPILLRPSALSPLDVISPACSIRSARSIDTYIASMTAGQHIVSLSLWAPLCGALGVPEACTRVTTRHVAAMLACGGSQLVGT
jgi:hypothetical protein